MNRRLCMEKIRILEDGTIPEVKMTSQGLGDPFGPGERIEGYRVCGLRGSAFVGGPEGEAERIVGICPGDEMMFRYLQGEPVYTELELESGGSGLAGRLPGGGGFRMRGGKDDRTAGSDRTGAKGYGI